MNLLFTKRLLSGIALSMMAGCALNYPRAPDADLFIPMIGGYSEQDDGVDFDYPQNVGAYRISRALEQEYFAHWLQDVDLSTCALNAEQAREKVTLVQITKILTPFDMDALKEQQSPYKDDPGGVLFGHGVKVEDATLLSLRFALSPLESERYRWSSKRSDLGVNLPYRYIKLEDISLSNEAIGLLNNKTQIYASESGSEVLRELDDEESVVIDSSLSYQELPARLPIRATRKLNLEFSDGPTNAPVRYDFPVNQDGYIELVNLSYFDDESKAYMSIVRSLILAQAGDCDTAYSVYRHIVESLNKETRVQMLFIIAHLHGQSGGNVNAVLDELEELASGEEIKYVEDYRELNKENL